MKKLPLTLAVVLLTPCIFLTPQQAKAQTSQQAAAQTTVYSAVNDFSAQNNPNGAWGYGYRASGGAYSPLTNNDNIYGFGAGMRTWYLPDAGWNLPAIFHNATGATTTYGTITQSTDKLNLHPGANGERSVVRWTAPSTLTVQATGHSRGWTVKGRVPMQRSRTTGCRSSQPM